MTTSIYHSAHHASCHTQPRSLFGKIANMLAISRQRRQLRDLDDHLLEDIGITRAEAIAESRQTLWNAPDHWRI